MAKEPLTNLKPDPKRLAVISECMERYDVGDPDAEWPNNIISQRAVVYESGFIAREGEPVSHVVDAEELALCRRLAAEVAALMAGVPVGMGSEAGDQFREFFIAGNANETPPKQIDEPLIRSRFGGTIFPPATITVEPLVEAGIWWSEVERDGSGAEADYFVPWRAMIRWFSARTEFVSIAFVRIGEQAALWHLPRAQWPAGTEITGCVLPRLAIGLTRGGSIVGLFGHSVQT
jgi:hypothetical protein